MSDTTGYLEVITGPMFSGKTTALLSLFEQAPENKRVLIKPKIDSRSGTVVRTHDGTEVEAVIVEHTMDITSRKEKYIFIDEGQFFDDHLVAVAAAKAKAGHIVRIAGLCRDFLDRPFGPMPELMLEADVLHKFWAQCSQCGGPFASKTKRLTDNHEQIEIGGAEAYEPRCRRCF
jgi:thymidine kinase